MPKFRKKPVVIEAFKWGLNDGEDFGVLGNDHMAEWLGASYVRIDGGRLAIKTLEGTITATPGDWIIRGIKGEFYPCKPEIFAATYETVDQMSIDPLAVQEADMCPNCVTPWKCNGPHEPDRIRGESTK